MVDQALEHAVRGVPIEPVDHVASIACAKRTHSAGIDPVKLTADMLHTGHNVLKRRTAPVPCDGAGERVSEPGAAVEVNS